MPESASLEAIYRSYVDLLNVIPTASEAEFSRFLITPVVNHNNSQLDSKQYRALIADARAGMPDMQFFMQHLVVDEEQGKCAASFIIEGTVEVGGEWLGVKVGKAEDGKEGGTRKVHVWENAFYRFEGGKIAEVRTVVDVDGFRKAMSRNGA